MLNIIINLEQHNTFDDILNYINHINNINNNIININIYIINCNINYNIINLNNINNLAKINIYMYEFKSNYNDSFFNDIINNIKYDYILFTNLHIYLTQEFIHYLNLNSIKDNIFIRTNIFNLNSISDLFYKSYNNNIYHNIIDNLHSVINHFGNNIIDSNTYIDYFNNNININIYNKNSIIDNSLFYLHNSNDFLLVHKNIIKKYGFNTNNNNYKYTFQYVIYNFIQNNIDMHILPYKNSVYKLYNNNNINITQDLFINYKTDFSCDITFNKHINYKIYDIIKNKYFSYIRNQIKTYKGYNPTTTVNENKLLKNENLELTELNNKYKILLFNNKIKLNLYYNNKWNIIYNKYNFLYKALDKTKKKLLSVIKLFDIS